MNFIYRTTAQRNRPWIDNGTMGHDTAGVHFQNDRHRSDEMLLFFVLDQIVVY